MCETHSSSSETPQASGLPPPPPPGKKTRKTLYVVLGVIAVAAVASAFGFVYFIPPSYRININSVPSGSDFITIDGKPVTTPYTASWQSGSTHNVTANSPVNSESGVQYAYSSWSDGEAQSHNVVVKSSANYTVSFVTLLPLTFNFTPGEEMVYNITENSTDLATIPASQNSSEIGTTVLDIISFDGENYTINETSTLQVFNSNFTTYLTYAMNKTGYITPISNSSTGIQLTSSLLAYFQAMFQKNEAKSGETWEVLPLVSTVNNSTVSFNGNLTETFGDIQNITVPAGTYRVFNVDLSGTNLTVVYNPPINGSISESFNVQFYLEYGTCRVIQINSQVSLSILLGTQTSKGFASEQVELVKHISP